MCTYVIIFIKDRCQTWLFWRDWWRRFFWFLKYKNKICISIYTQNSNIIFKMGRMLSDNESMWIRWSMAQYWTVGSLPGSEQACNQRWSTSTAAHSRLLRVWWIWDWTSSPADCSCLSLSWRFCKVPAVFGARRPRPPPPVWDGGMRAWPQALLLPQCYKRQA